MGSTPKKPWASFVRRDPKTLPPTTGQERGAAGRPKPNSTPQTVSPYDRNDPIPEAEAVEKDTDTSWALFNDLANSENRKFADTAPASRTLKDSSEEGGYAATEPAPLQKLQALPQAPVRRELSVTEVMVEARRNNRVCPKPAKWLELYEMLPDKRRSGTSWEPAPPLVDAAWNETSSIPKRMCFREHIDWADSHGWLEQIFSFMKGLPENEWHHMGE